MKLLISITFIFIVISFIADRKKTFDGAMKSIKMFIGILPSFLVVIILVSVFLYFFPQKKIIAVLGKDAGFIGFITAGLFGSIALIPGFIAYPLSAILIKGGVSYKIIAVFINTLMMVGIITLPLESKYFGIKVTVTRNVLNFIGALLVGFLMGLFL